MSEKKITVPIKGMHCRSCEILVEEKLSEIDGIKKVNVDHKNGGAEIYCEQKIDPKKIETAVREAGYSLGTEEKAGFWSKNASDYKDLGIAFILLLGLYFILKSFGLTNMSLDTSGEFSIPFVMVIGLTAGFSTCMALVGGLILGVSARHADQHPEATPMQKFKPHLFFNFGRMFSYVLLGGLLGMLGSLFQLSSLTLGIITIAVGLVMLGLGLQLIEIFPWAEKLKITMPKSISKALGITKHQKEYSHKSSFLLGGLTFFLPCGFTQAMQLYAVSSGSFTQGAMIMGAFALGTAPGLLGVGGLTSIIKGVFAKRFFKFAGLVVIFLSLFNISNGFNLTGWSFASPADSAVSADPNVTLKDGVQIVKMTEDFRGYSPSKFTIKKGIPVKWIIDAQAPYSCAASLMASKLGISKNLKAGENIIEFTPKETGKINFSCSMGMYRGYFNVVDEKDGQKEGAAEEDNFSPVPGTCGSGNAGGCGGSASGSCGGSGGCGSKKTNSKPSSSASSEPAINTGVQILKTEYDNNNDIQPNNFRVKAGTPVRLEIDVKESGYGCMSTIMIPGLYETAELLEGGTTLVMEFTPKKTGSYQITCAMGVPRGTLTVE